MQKNRKKLRDTGRKLIRDLREAEKEMKIQKTNYENARRQQDKAQEEYEKANFNNSQSPAVEKAAKKVTGDTKKAEQAETKYSEAVKALIDIQTKNYTTELPQCLDELERIEETRIQLLKNTLENFSNLQGSLAPEISESVNRMKSSICQISAKADLQTFTQEKKTGLIKPPLAEYELYDPATQSCKSSDKPAVISSPINAPAPPVVPPRETVITAPKDGVAIQPKIAVLPITSVSLKKMNISNNKNTPKEPGMPLKESISSPINVVKEPVVTITQNPTPPAREPMIKTPLVIAKPKAITAKINAIGKARGLYNYTTSDPQELSFNAGDVINILQKDPSGWWQGEINGKIGVFPSTDWIEELDLNGNLIKPIDKDAVPDYKKCRALYAYNSESEYEISITAGEILTIEGLDDDGWYTGWNEKGDYGRFPSNYCADYE